MGGILQVDTIQNNNATTLITQTNSTTLTFGVSGQNIVIPSGVTFNTASATVNYPAGSITNADIASAAAIATTKLGAGAIIKVSSIASAAGLQTLATTTYTDLTSLSLSITPSSASNKILLIANINCDLGNDEGFGIRFLRDATNVFTTTQQYAIYNAGTSDTVYTTSPFVYIDSPSTTSSITYKVQGAAYVSNSIVFNQGMASIFYAIEIAG